MPRATWICAVCPSCSAASVACRARDRRLGLSFDPAGERVRFRHPRLPDFLDQVVLRKLQVGDSQFDIMLHRYGNDVSVNILDRRGDGRVSITL
jgi:hypothetical protein